MRRVAERLRWQSMSIDERRVVIARRSPEAVSMNEQRRFQRHKEKRMALSAQWRKDNPERSREIVSASNDRHPKKRAARVAVGNALRSGRLVKQACEVCGSGRTHAHHDDYSQPLNVRWLCPTHHAEIHHGGTRR